MAFSDDEVEDVAESVTNYYFVDNKDEPISFSVLPIRWSENESSASSKQYVFLHGTTDSGLESIYKKVIAWRLEFSYDQPEISVLYKEKGWIKLQKPRKSFEDTIRTILITIHCLHFVKKHPQKSESSLWIHLQKVFSSYKVKPSVNDLLDHWPLLKYAVKQDQTFANSVIMLKILKDPRKRKVIDEDIYPDSAMKKSKLMTDKELDEEKGATKGNESHQVWELCDDVCALCDNGGDVLCCEGRCLRSFHATVDTGFHSGCTSLGLSQDQVEATPSFLCLNCQYNQHQCFACGKLGSSDRVNYVEVFRCASANCGHFYHPRCIAKLLHPINSTAAENLQKRISEGESFTCIVHKCSICKQEENKDNRELQFAICRRCPKVYHRKCLPREISFESFIDQGILQRAWDELLPNRVLIYCSKHELDVSTLTPKRDHIIFPDVQENKKKRPLCSQPSRGKLVTTKINLVSKQHSKKDPVLKVKQVVKKPCAIKVDYSTKIHTKQTSREISVSSKKPQTVNASSMHLKETVKHSSVKGDKSSAFDKTIATLKKESLKRKVKPVQQAAPCSKFESTVRHIPATKKSNNSPPSVRTETEMRKRDLVKGKSLLKTSETIGKSLKEASSHASSSSNTLDKAIPLGNVEGSLKAVEYSLEKLKDHSFVDTKAAYDFENFDHLTNSKIADKLHCYAQSGDTIVSFCSDANDFSRMMRQKLEETGKRCSFESYHVFQPKGDFDFENTKLPTGSRLIMGLKFPSGDGVPVDKYIDRVLEFKPKLLVLICPRETNRLDENKWGYDLIWEEGEIFSCKSYLSGSVQLKQTEQRTFESPLVYLWSRCDWTSKHKSIAQNQDQISNEQHQPEMEDSTDYAIDFTNQTNNLNEIESEVVLIEEAREIIYEMDPNLFAPGPLPQYLHSNWSCGWLE